MSRILVTFFSASGVTKKVASKLASVLNADLHEIVPSDLTGKKIISFATSGISGMGNTNKELRPSCVGAELLDGKRLSKDVSEIELKNWVRSLNY